MPYSPLCKHSLNPPPNTSTRARTLRYLDRHLETSAAPPESLARTFSWCWHQIIAEVPWRHDLPTIPETLAARETWLAEERRAQQLGDPEELRIIRANTEQLTRQLTRLQALTQGAAVP
ncbi:MAG UNVERIFIED_CONTAM: hypothetical protein LVR18_35840 [Planctomycetaceae bacterium]